jgi:copper chaperone CopZ/YHS domain-containing protein
METILPILLFGGAFLLMMRFGCGSHAGGHGEQGKQGGGCCSGGGHGAKKAQGTGHGRFVTPEKKTDPVCGKTVSSDKAKSTVHGGEVFYFCERDCREAFEAAPHLYVPSPSDGTSSPLQGSKIALRTAPTTELEVTRLAIEGMSCSSCVSHIEETLRQAPGVISAHVDFKSGMADVTHQPDGGIADSLAEAVRKTGYGAIVATGA